MAHSLWIGVSHSCTARRGTFFSCGFRELEQRGLLYWLQCLQNLLHGMNSDQSPTDALSVTRDTLPSRNASARESDISLQLEGNELLLSEV